MVSKRVNQLCVLIAGVSIHFYNGYFYSWGNLAPYVISYFFHFGGSDGKGEDVDLFDSVYFLPIGAGMLMFMNPAGAFLIKLVHPKLMIVAGSLIGVASALLAAKCATFFQFLIAFAILNNVGVGLCYFPPLVCGWEWMHRRKGIVTGIILGAYGFSGFFLSFVSLVIVNPDNASPEVYPNGDLFYSEEISARVPYLLKVFAGIFGCLGFISFVLIKRNPDFVDSASFQGRQLTIKEALSDRAFFLICSMEFFTILPLIYMAGSFKAMGMQIGRLDDFTLTLIGSCGNIANGLSRIFWGALNDKVDFKYLYRIILCIELILCATMVQVVKTSPYLYLVSIFLGYAILGGHFVLFPLVMMKAFGQKTGGRLASFLYTAKGISSLVGLLLARAFSNYFGIKAYFWMYWLCCLLVVVSAFIKELLFEPEMRRRLQDKGYKAVSDIEF